MGSCDNLLCDNFRDNFFYYHVYYHRVFCSPLVLAQHLLRLLSQVVSLPPCDRLCDNNRDNQKNIILSTCEFEIVSLWVFCGGCFCCRLMRHRVGALWFMFSRLSPVALLSVLASGLLRCVMLIGRPLLFLAASFILFWCICCMFNE